MTIRGNPAKCLLTLCAALVATGLLPSMASAAECPEANPNDSNSDRQEIQDCLDLGGVVELEWGWPGYIIDGAGLSIDVPGTILTSIDQDKPYIVAANSLAHTMLYVPYTTYDFELSILSFNGRKSDRSQGEALCDHGGHRGDASNLVILGSKFLIHHVDSINALCGSALEVSGEDFEIYSGWYTDNGFTGAEKSTWEQPWADGITVTGCYNGYIHNNDVHNNTDIGIVIGAGDGCVARWNAITQDDRYVFAGFHVGAFHVDEVEHSNAVYQFNDVIADEDTMAAGWIVGFHPWHAQVDTADAGESIENDMDGAVVNLTIDGVRNGTVYDNELQNPQGSAGLWGCTYSGNYTAADFEGGLTLQAGYAQRGYHPTGCFTW